MGQKITHLQRICHRWVQTPDFLQDKKMYFYIFKLQYFSCTTSLTLKALLSFLVGSQPCLPPVQLLPLFEISFKLTCTLGVSSTKRCPTAIPTSWLPTLPQLVPISAIRMSTQDILKRGHHFLEGICRGIGDTVAEGDNDRIGLNHKL